MSTAAPASPLAAERLFESYIKASSDADSLSQFFAGLEHLLHDLTPPARFILVMLLWPTIQGVMGNLASAPIQKFLDRHSESRPPEETHSGPQRPVGILRFALYEGVRIRQNPDVKSEVVSRMHRGQIVVVLNAKRGWFLIRLRSGDTEVIGWTYGNTLGKFTNSL